MKTVILISLTLTFCAVSCQSVPHTGAPVQGVTFLTSQQLKKLRETSPDQKYCKARISSVASNNPGCSDADCEKQWKVGQKVSAKCDGDTCPMKANTWYAAPCGELLSGCKVQVDTITACE